MNDRAVIEKEIGARHRVLLILWAAQGMALLTLFLLALFVFERREDGNDTLAWILFGSSLVLVLLSFVIKQKLFAVAVEKQSVAQAQSGMIVAIALCEAAGLFGLLARALTGTPHFYLPFIIAALGLLLHFPRREQLMAAAYRDRF